MDGFIQLISIGLTGGAIGAFLTFLVSKQRENRNNFTAIIETWAADNARLRESEEILRQRILALENEIIQLKEQLIRLEAVQNRVVTEQINNKTN